MNDACTPSFKLSRKKRVNEYKLKGNSVSGDVMMMD